MAETLDGIIRRELTFRGEDESRYEQYYFFAEEVMRDLKMDIVPSQKTVVLELDKMKRVKFPDDFLTWLKIGIQRRSVRGSLTRRPEHILTFVKDRELAFQLECDDDDQKIEYNDRDATANVGYNFDYGTSVSFSNVTNLYGEHLGRQYGLKSASNAVGYFRIHKRERYFQINSSLVNKGDKIYLEYVGDESESFSPNTVVHSNFVKMVRLYIDWQISENNDRLPTNQKDRKERLYWDEFSRARSREMEWDVEELMEASRAQTNSVKY